MITCLTIIQMELEFGNFALVFEERGNGSTHRKPLRARARTNNKLNPHTMPSPGFEHRPQVLSPLCHPCSTSIGA